MTNEDAVREAFRLQARYCSDLGSAFTALLCEVLGKKLDRYTAVGERVLSWQGKPDALNDSVPLRLTGGLHALAMSKKEPALTALYPPNPLPDADALWTVVGEVLVIRAGDLLRWLDYPPQTNEVARSAVLMAGLLVIASQTKLPLSLYEAGASAGLNLILDRYSYRLGDVEAGIPGAKVRLAPQWIGPSPPHASIEIVRRRGVDLLPIDLSTSAGRERLLAYVWPDQSERLARTAAALEIACADPPRIDAGDAADWIENEIGLAPEAGIVRVLMHSIAFQYFSADAQRRIADHVERVGRRAHNDAVLAWLRMEGATDRGFSLTLTMWPSGDERVLAIAHPHGAHVEWK